MFQTATYNSRNEEMCAVNIVHKLPNSTCFLIISVLPITAFSTSATPVSGVTLTSCLRTNKPAEMNIMNETSDPGAETAFAHTDAVTKTNMLITLGRNSV